jgi:hypothetical protein
MKGHLGVARPPERLEYRPCRIASGEGPGGAAGWRWRRAASSPAPSCSASRPPPALTAEQEEKVPAPVRSRLKWYRSARNSTALIPDWLDPVRRDEQLAELTVLLPLDAMAAVPDQRKETAGVIRTRRPTAFPASDQGWRIMTRQTSQYVFFTLIRKLRTPFLSFEGVFCNSNTSPGRTRTTS